MFGSGIMVLVAIIHHCKSIFCYSPKSRIADVRRSDGDVDGRSYRRSDKRSNEDLDGRSYSDSDGNIGMGGRYLGKIMCVCFPVGSFMLITGGETGS